MEFVQLSPEGSIAIAALLLVSALAVFKVYSKYVNQIKN